MGYDTRLVEWHQEGGAPYTFRIEVDVMGRAVTDATYGEIERTALRSKNVRSHLTGLRAIGRVSGPAYLGAVCLGGEETTILPWSPPETEATGPLFVGGAVGSVEAVTIYPAGYDAAPVARPWLCEDGVPWADEDETPLWWE
nr:phage tail protein [Roseospira navarrensis]